jgi:hypothetical protein
MTSTNVKVSTTKKFPFFLRAITYQSYHNHVQRHYFIQIIPSDATFQVHGENVVEALDFLMGYESYLRRILVSSRRYKPTGKHRHSLPLSLVYLY